MIENYIGKIDNLIPEILSKMLKCLKLPKMSKLFQAGIYQVIAMCIFYNPKLAFDYFEAQGCTGSLMQTWFGLLEQFTHDH